MEKGKRNLLIFWGVIIVIIIIELFISSGGKKKSDGKNVAVGANETINQKVQDVQKIEEKPKEEKKNETRVNFSKNSVILYVGASETLNFEEANLTGLTWTSSHDNIASVSSSGTVTGVSIGTSIIKAESADGTYATCNVIVAQNVNQTSKTEITQPDINNIPNDNQTSMPDDYIPNDYIPDDGEIENPLEENYDDNFQEPIVPDDMNEDNNEENQEPEEPAKYNVIFLSNGEIIEKIEVQEGNTLEVLPITPMKAGYTFKGWYLNGEEVTTNTIINDNVTIIGEWDSYTFAVNPILADINSPNRVIVAYKNGNIIGVSKVCGQLNGNQEYILGTMNRNLGAVKVISYAQLLKASNYKLMLSTGDLVFADILD